MQAEAIRAVLFRPVQAHLLQQTPAPMKRRVTHRHPWKPEIREEAGVYSIESERARGIFYEVRLEPPSCTCADFSFQ